ncbi:MAG TPA: AAA family ATPase [Acidimicrobiia bacterium]|jgi:2-phosphoglycerate kinase|nr:AAA family ATPase [Acidimicrobiia bacterium]
MVDGSKVVLIGGAPGSGKTTLAEAVAKDLGWRWLPGDALVTAMRGVASPETHPDLHLSPGGTHVEYFTNGPPAKLVADAIALQAAAWQGFEHVIRFHARYGPSVVIDSWTFSPGNVAALGLSNVIGFWIIIDPAALDEREKPPPGYVDPSTNPARRRANFRHRSLWCNDFVQREATRLGMALLYQDGATPLDVHVATIGSRVGPQRR